MIMLFAEVVFVFFVSKNAYLWSKREVLMLWGKVKEQSLFVRRELKKYKNQIMWLFTSLGITLGEVSKHGVRFILLICIPVSLVVVVFCCAKNYRLQEIEKHSMELDRMNLEIRIQEDKLKHAVDSLILIESKIANENSLDTLKSEPDKNEL